jgi:ELWxxDGT repeat protein/YVTN family beta-propeller protein
LLAGATAAGENAFAGPAFLVRNIDPGVDLQESSEPRNFVAAGDLVFFTADDGEHGRELWRTDGTPGGTILLRDIAPGVEHGVYDAPVPFGNLVAFRVSGASLWRSDGTADGTFALLEQYPVSMAGIGERLFFVTEEWKADGSFGHILWASDGSREGTVPLRWFADTDPGDESCDHMELQAARNRLYAISSSDCALRTRIWALDASSAVDIEATQVAAPIELAVRFEYDGYLASAGDILLFVGTNAEAAVGVWRSDGTAAGSYLLPPGAGDQGLYYDDYRRLVQDGQRAFFFATDGVHGLEPWVTDGTAAGTHMVADVVAGSVGVYPCRETRECVESSGMHSLRVSLIPRENDLLIGRNYYKEGVGTVSELWVTDGTVTRRVDDVVPGARFGYQSVAGRGHSLLFRAQHGNDVAVWHGDGTLAGSRRVAAVAGDYFVEAANGFIFLSWEPSGAGAEPWWSDGTPEGTYLLRDIRRGDASSAPRDLTELNGVLIFSATTAAHGRELWRSDATADGTTPAVDIQPGPGGAAPAEITRLGDVVLFAADDGVHGTELWSSDGTAAGTAMVRDIQPGDAGAHPRRLAVVDGLLYFYADDGVHGVELWSSDGTAAGTRLVADVNPHGDGGGGDTLNWGTGRYIVGLDGTVYFVADDGTHGAELWRSDGPGTANLVADIYSGAASSWPHSLVAATGAIYFNVHLNDLSYGSDDLWRSDGTEAGTGPALAPPFEVDTAAQRIDDSVVFLSQSPDGIHLTSVDPSGRNTSTALPNLCDYERFQTPVGSAGSIFLVGVEGLWRSDVGMLEPYDYHVGGLSTVSDVGGKLVIAVRDGNDELVEIWTSDGTPYGAVRLQYLLSSTHSYYYDYEDRPQLDFVAAGDHVFFSADAGDTGRELWALPLSALPDVQPLATPTATVPIGGDATPTPTATATATVSATAEDTATATPTATAPCALEGDPPGCARIEVDDITATAGDTATIAAHLRSLGEPIAALQVDLTFDRRMRVIAASNGSPRCRVDAGLGKDATSFAFAPASCEAGGAECATVRALVLSFTNLDPIADGSPLFSCDVRIDEDAPAATYPVTASKAGAAGSAGSQIDIGARDGSITVVRRAASNLDPATSSSGSCAIDPQPTTGIAPIAAALLAIIIARARRPRPRRRVRGTVSFLLPIAQLALFVGLTARASSAEPFAYVANLGADSIDVIDLETHEVVATLPAGDDPNGIATSADGQRVYVTNFFSNDVTVVDTATQRVVDTIAVGDGPVGIAVSPDGQRAYVANRARASVSVIDIAAGQVEESVAVDRGPNSVALTPDGATAAVTSSFTRFPGIVSFIDLPGLAVGTAEVQRNPTRVAIAPDGQTAWVTNFRSWNVSVLDIASRQAVTTVRLSGRPSGIAFNPNGTFAYVTSLDGFLQVIDVPFHRVHTKIPVGGSPYGIGIVRNGGVGYVPSFDDDTVTVVDLAHHEALETIAVGDRPFAVAVT